MNGMQRKKAKKEHAKRWTEDGLPRDDKDWTEEDWKDLHEGIEAIKRKIAERHQRERDNG